MFIKILLVALTVMYPLVLYCGMLTAFKLGQGKEVKPLITPLKKKPAPLTNEQIKERKIWENVVNFDGTPESQKVVE